MGTTKSNEYEDLHRVREFLLEIMINNNLNWGDFLKLLYACGIDISAQFYAKDFDHCKETMRTVLEISLKCGDKIYGTKAKD